VCYAITNIETLLSIKLESITDRKNYHENIDSSLSLLIASLSIGFPIILFLEPLFQLLLFLFSLLQFDSDITLKIIIFIMLMLMFYFLHAKAKINIFWSIMIALSPVVLANYVMTIRQGVASTFFLFGYFSSSRKKKYISYILTPLVHYSFYFVLPIKYLSIKLNNFKSNPKIFILVFILSSFIASLFIISFSKLLYIDKLQGYYENQVEAKFGLGIIFWLIVLFLFILEGNYFIKKWSYQTLILSFYIGSVMFFNPSSRILQVNSVLILIAGFSLTGYRNIFFKTILILLILYFFIEYIFTGQFGSMIISD